MKNPEYRSEAVVFESKDYVVKVGWLDASVPPKYLVVRKDYEVVEFQHEVLAVVKQWIEHFEKENHPEVAQQEVLDWMDNNTGAPN